MSQQTHLFRRNSCYYFRAKVPVDLQRYLGKTEEKFSLKTKDHQEAKRLARQASADFDRRCERLREALRARRTGKAPRVIDDALIQEICALCRHHALAGDEYSRQEGWFADELDARTEERRATGEALRDTLQHSRLERIEPALQTFLHLLGAPINRAVVLQTRDTTRARPQHLKRRKDVANGASVSAPWKVLVPNQRCLVPGRVLWHLLLCLNSGAPAPVSAV